ncbi:MAG: NAD-dependent epimerase/dehydratase family protein, partial [Actinomycetota bacterium]
KTEDDPLEGDPPAAFRRSVDALHTLESAVTGYREGVVLRYGLFYGPGTAYAANGFWAEQVRKRRFPVVGDGAGMASFIHVDDAASATVASLDGPAGIYNIVDDDPAPMREWLPAYAGALGVRRPRRVPIWLARLVAGEFAVYLATEARGASNAKAKRDLGWIPRFPSWREGFPAALA